LPQNSFILPVAAPPAERTKPNIAGELVYFTCCCATCRAHQTKHCRGIVLFYLLLRHLQSAPNQTLPRNSFILLVAAPPVERTKPIIAAEPVFFSYFCATSENTILSIAEDLFYLTCFCATREPTKPNIAGELVSFDLFLCH
jgi:hypothetical protein